jgi:hypothetical protein
MVVNNTKQTTPAQVKKNHKYWNHHTTEHLGAADKPLAML